MKDFLGSGSAARSSITNPLGASTIESAGVGGKPPSWTFDTRFEISFAAHSYCSVNWQRI